MGSDGERDTARGVQKNEFVGMGALLQLAGIAVALGLVYHCSRTGGFWM